MNRRFTRARMSFNPFSVPGLLFMADGDDDKGGGGGGGADDKGGDDDKGGKGGKGGSDWTPPASQADLDRIITERLTRERGKFADYDALKAKAAEHDKALEAAKTEQEKAVDAARKEGAESVTSAGDTRFIGSEARALAAAAKFRNPALAVRSIDLTGIKVGADGEVDAAAITALLTKLATDEPYLVDDGKTGKPRPDGSQGPREHSDATGVEAGRARFAASRGTSTTTTTT